MDHIVVFKNHFVRQCRKQKLAIVVKTPTPSSNDFNALAEQLRASILSGPQAKWVDEIMAHAAPTIVIDLERMEQSEAGRSFVSGKPTLPRDVTWPIGKEGVPLGFLGQIDLGEVPCPADHPLPGQGLLHFFVCDDDPGDGVEHLVLYQPSSSAETMVVSAPEGTEMPRWLMEASPCRLKFKPHVAMPFFPDPPAHHPDVRGFEDEIQRLCDALGYRSGESNMLGPVDDFEDGREAAVLYASGFEAFVYDAHRSLEDFDKKLASMRYWHDRSLALRQEALRPSFVDYLAQREELMAAKVDWLLLFEFGSHQVDGLEFYSCWGDAGSIQFWINRHDLANLNFSNTYCCTTSN